MVPSKGISRLGHPQKKLGVHTDASCRGIGSKRPATSNGKADNELGTQALLAFYPHGATVA